ncbi:zinc ribbon domain-containing protein [Sciscionella sediminilitoris]|uniref:zinc ribbon domain-containing protein n=1 Tax=Sciscionella sediminilitoris TaxID=1445613 RepID=UPI0004DF34FB|nr:C4-type zinc ribbon domain-containing protein [Sciscionella sp. SE31]
MKVDPAVQARLLDLAETDAELGRIEHRRRNLPELEALSELETTLRERRDAVIKAETALSDLDADAARQEKDIDSVRAREERDRKLLDSGLPGKQQTDLEHELETLHRRQSALEDDLLELMERREAVEADVKHSQAQLTVTEDEISKANERRDTALEELDTKHARRTEDREQLLGELPAELVTLYEKVRAQRGTGAAMLRAKRCGACRLELDRSALAELRDAAADQVCRCEECGAILVRTKESGL